MKRALCYLQMLSIVFVGGVFFLALGCGGGSGGGQSIPQVIRSHITGSVIASGTISNSIQANIVAAVNVTDAEVYLESMPEINSKTDSTGRFDLFPVPAGTYRVITRFKNINQTYKNRSEQISVSESTPEKDVGPLNLLVSNQIVRGILRDSQGNPIPNSSLTLWGEPFSTNFKGEFETPLMPAGAKGVLSIQSAGFQAVSLDFTFDSPVPPYIDTTLAKTEETTNVKDSNGNPMTNVFTQTFTTTAVVDVTPPTLISIIPASGASDISIFSAITLIFSETMDYSTLDTTNIKVASGGVGIAGTLWVSPDRTTVIFNASSALAYSTIYTVTVTTAAKDGAGNPLGADVVRAFTTTSVVDSTPPTVVSVIPASGATNISNTSLVSLIFSEPMDISTFNDTNIYLTNGGVNIPGALSVGPDRTIATFTSTSFLPAGVEIIVTVTKGVKDSAGNAFAANFVSSFTTKD